MNSTKDFFTIVSTPREENGKLYYRSFPSINYNGMCLIADKYNSKYFINESNKRIIVAASKIGFQQQLEPYLKSNKDCMIGFSVPQREGASGHPTPVIFEIHNGKKYLFINDSVGYDTLANSLQLFCEKNNIDLYENPYGRQVDNGSCKSDCLAYLKNSLQMESIAASVTLLNKEETTQYLSQTPSDRPGMPKHKIFLPTGDMLKTIQTSKVLGQNQLDVNQPLVSTKSKNTYMEKMSGYHKGETYYETIDRNTHVKSGDTKVWKERTYLRQKTETHHKQIIDILENKESDYINAAICRAANVFDLNTAIAQKNYPLIDIFREKNTQEPIKEENQELYVEYFKFKLRELLKECITDYKKNVENFNEEKLLPILENPKIQIEEKLNKLLSPEVPISDNFRAHLKLHSIFQENGSPSILLEHAIQIFIEDAKNKENRNKKEHINIIIDKHLHLFTTKAKWMALQGAEYSNASWAMDEIVRTIKRERELFNQAPLSQFDQAQQWLLASCTDIIDRSKDILGKHRGYKELFVQFLSGVTSVSTLGVANYATKKSFYGLFPARTDSAKMLDNFTEEMKGCSH
ncbi:hypothetical protein [Legionella sainthelensi]|uniref:hypothetical protein n=1 Tax=Legionella sainthelensi TaxID=28087 RepID=UPI000E20703E|nr:hypothetical protein [Legionella sainthelensi]